MSFKSIELQVAIPRSQDAGKMQDQMMRQSQQFQDTLTQQQLREEIINRSRVNEFDNVEKKMINDEDDTSKREEEQKQKKQKQTNNQDSESKIDHPYLGTKFDYSG